MSTSIYVLAVACMNAWLLQLCLTLLYTYIYTHTYILHMKKREKDRDRDKGKKVWGGVDEIRRYIF